MCIQNFGGNADAKQAFHSPVAMATVQKKHRKREPEGLFSLLESSDSLKPAIIIIQLDLCSSLTKQFNSYSEIQAASKVHKAT